MRSDSGGEFSVNSPFGALCRERGTIQELTTANNPERNAVEECGIALIKSSALATRLHAPELFLKVGVPKSTGYGLRICLGQPIHPIVVPPERILNTADRLKCDMESLRQTAFYRSGTGICEGLACLQVAAESTGIVFLLVPRLITRATCIGFYLRVYPYCFVRMV